MSQGELELKAALIAIRHVTRVQIVRNNRPKTKAMAKAYNIYVTPQPATAAAAALSCHRQCGRTVYRPYPEPSPTDFDLHPNSHMPPWSAV